MLKSPCRLLLVLCLSVHPDFSLLTLNLTQFPSPTLLRWGDTRDDPFNTSNGNATFPKALTDQEGSAIRGVHNQPDSLPIVDRLTVIPPCYVVGAISCHVN
jgi:hypothetical protein